MQVAFFNATKRALNNITSTFDTVWPISVGLWNLRCAVNGIKNEFPEISERELAAKFSVGSGIHGVNYKRAFIERSWNEQKSDFAWILLNNTFCIFEGWLQDLNESLFSSMKPKDLQYPDKVRTEISRLTACQSDVMKNCFYSAYTSKRDRNYANIEPLLHCYRVFKETRNCYMHNAKKADSKLIDAYNQYLPYVHCAMLDVTEVPEFIPPILNEEIQISLRGVVGFSYILIKIIVTLDAELICSHTSEKEFIDRFKASQPIVRTLKTDPVQANNQIRCYTVQAGFCKPESIDELKTFLLSKHLVSR